MINNLAVFQQLLDFDLIYYDGLANQDAEIRLTVSTVRRPLVQKRRPDVFESGTASSNSGNNNTTTHHKDLVPPLEHVIRTRWPDAKVDWNGTEPLR